MKNEHPTYYINSKQSVFSLNLHEVWEYRDLLLMLMKRDFITFYKQTILGPLWFIVQPLLTTLIYVVLFGNIAKLSIVGAGMMSNPGVAAKMFESLYNEGVNINMISTSEIRVTVLINEKDGVRAMNAVHDAFNLAD